MTLLMVNGACGVGKSETSRALQARIPGSEWIRLDDVRKTIPESQFMRDGEPDAVARMWHANVVGRQMAREVLRAGNTAIIDAIKYQTEWVEPWESLGRDLGAKVLDVCLTAPKHVVEARALERGYRSEGRLTPEKVSSLYDKVAAFYEDRPNAIMINTDQITPASTADLIIASYLQPAREA